MLCLSCGRRSVPVGLWVACDGDRECCCLARRPFTSSAVIPAPVQPCTAWVSHPSPFVEAPRSGFLGHAGSRLRSPATLESARHARRCTYGAGVTMAWQTTKRILCTCAAIHMLCALTLPTGGYWRSSRTVEFRLTHTTARQLKHETGIVDGPPRIRGGRSLRLRTWCAQRNHRRLDTR